MREIPSTNRLSFAFLLSICVLHLGIRLYLINQQGFFYDETTTWSYSQSPESLILAMVSDIHPPLYFALMGVWTKLFGTSEIAFRLPSVLGSFLTMITLMVFAREIDQRRNFVLPILVGALYVCLPYDIHLSKTARSWTMAVFLCGLFSYLYACVTLRDKKNWFVGSLIVAICAVFVHYITLISVAAAVTAATLIQPTKANLRYAGKTLGIIFTFLLPYLLLVFPCQLIAKIFINPFHFYFFWQLNAVSCLLEPINPGSWNPFLTIELSAGVFHGTGLFLALVGVALVLFRAGGCWANRLTRFMMLQVGIMIIFLLLSPTPLWNLTTMCIFLPPFLLLLSFTLKDLFTSKRLPALLVSGVFVTSFVAMSLSGFPYPSGNASLREITEFLRPSWNSARHPAAFLSPSNHLLTLQYLQSRGSTVFTEVFFAPDPVVLLDSPWYEPLHPEMMELPSKKVPRWNRGPQEHSFVWTMNRLFAMNRGVTDVFYLREGAGNLFEWTKQGRVELSQLEDEAQFVMTRMRRSGNWTVYHLQPRYRLPVSGPQHNEAQASSSRVDDEQTGGSAAGM